MFRRHVARSGALELRWPPVSDVTLAVWVLLVDPAETDPSTLAAEALLRELIRIPADPAAGAMRLHVPVGRPIGVALVARGPDERVVEPPALTIRDEVAPLRFARDAKGTTPDLAALARRIAEQTGAPATAPAPPGPTGFGTRQHWYLTHLAFEARRPDAARVAVIRATFIAEAELRAWASAPPADAIALPPEADALVDALTPEDAMAFYAVLEADADGAWRPIPLAPIPPPFERAKAPHFVGDARARLAPLLARATEVQRALLDDALRGAP